MNNVALFVRLDAIRGKEMEVERFLESALSVAEDDPDTLHWYALKLGPSSYAIFNIFPDKEGRRRHLLGDVTRSLIAKAPNLFACTPSIEEADILAAKVAEYEHL